MFFEGNAACSNLERIHNDHRSHTKVGDDWRWIAESDGRTALPIALETAKLEVAQV